MNKYTIVDIEYEFDFHISRSHPKKVALKKIVATARLLGSPDVVVEKILLRPGIDFINQESYVLPQEIEISKDDRMYLMSRIDWEIAVREVSEQEETVRADAKDRARQLMRDSWSEYIKGQSGEAA